MRQNSESTDTSGDTTFTVMSDDSMIHGAAGTETTRHCRECYHQRTMEHGDTDDHEMFQCQGYTPRKQNDLQTIGSRCFKKREIIYGFIVVFISVTLSVPINKLSTLFEASTPTPSPEMTTQTLDIQEKTLENERLCFECALLRAYIDQWAWKYDVTENPLFDECCFNDYLTLLRTFKFYTDVKVSQLQSELSRTSRDMRQIHDVIRNISEASRTVTNDTVLPQIIYHIPEEIREMIGSIAQKKRSILYLKSEGLVNSDKNSFMALISWSFSDLLFPIVQGNLELLHEKTGIMNTETGYYSIRVEVKFKAHLQPNQTQHATLRYYVKYLPEQGNPITVEIFTETFTFSEDQPEYKGVVYKVTKLRKGDRVEVHVPRNDNFVSRDLGTHSISIIEES